MNGAFDDRINDTELKCIHEQWEADKTMSHDERNEVIDSTYTNMTNTT